MTKSSAQVAYEAWARAFPGDAGTCALPWHALPKYVQECWDVAMKAVGVTTW